MDKPGGLRGCLLEQRQAKSDFERGCEMGRRLALEDAKKENFAVLEKLYQQGRLSADTHYTLCQLLCV